MEKNFHSQVSTVRIYRRPAIHRYMVRYGLVGLITVLILLPKVVFSQEVANLPSPGELKKLSVEELMNIEVTSVSKRPEKLTEVASAIQVITHEDIHRSGATSIPEALRLAPNLQVAQLNSSAWIISARGFNAPFSNKLLVMIDGRTVYSPLFAGVFWDVQSVLMEDIDRIEVISGPGGTLWGANAVNGVINIITKKTSDTKGLYAEGGAGSYLRAFGGLRYGGNISSNLSYRVYAQYAARDPTFLPDGKDNSDKWGMGQSGFSLDWNPDEKNAVTAQGNFYNGVSKTIPSESTVDGQNILGRWSHVFSEQSNLSLQVYFDRTWRRDIPTTISDELETYDIDFQHRFMLRPRHNILWGGGYRFMHNETLHSTPFLGLLPPTRNMKLFSSFIQDEIALVPDRLRLILGTKLQHNNFSNFEWQPSARVAWTAARNTLWGAVSRAVRAPSRIDVDYYLPTYPVPPNSLSVAGGPNFTSEKVIAYEVGYRVHPSTQLSLSLAAFYNVYKDLYSVEALPGTFTYQIQNGTQGKSRGVEFSGTYQLIPNWRLRGGYTHFHKDLENKPGRVYDYSDLGYDAENLLLLHSMLDLPGNFQFDLTVRYLDRLKKPKIPDYFTFDSRIAWTYHHLEISVVGQNLWEARHREISFQIPRTIYAKLACRF